MKKFLITLNDLCHILNKKDVEILNFIDEGMPHYYYHDVLYFEYDEVQDWIIKRIDLGVAGLNIHTLVTYLKRCMNCEIKPSTLFSKIREYSHSIQDHELRARIRISFCAWQHKARRIHKMPHANICNNFHNLRIIYKR